MDFYGDRKVYMYEIEQNKTRITDFYEQVTKISKIKHNCSIQMVKFVKSLFVLRVFSKYNIMKLSHSFVYRCSIAQFLYNTPTKCTNLYIDPGIVILTPKNL